MNFVSLEHGMIVGDFLGLPLAGVLLETIHVKLTNQTVKLGFYFILIQACLAQAFVV